MWLRWSFAVCMCVVLMAVLCWPAVLMVVFVSLQCMVVECQGPGRGELRRSVAVCKQCSAVCGHLIAPGSIMWRAA